MVYNLAIFLAYFALFLQFSPVASPLAGLHPTAAVFALRAGTPDQSTLIKHHMFAFLVGDRLLALKLEQNITKKGQKKRPKCHKIEIK